MQHINSRQKLYVITLSTQDDNKLFEQLKTGFKRTIKWNKYTSKMTKHTKTNNLNYLITPTSIDYLCCHLKMKKDKVLYFYKVLYSKS